MTDSDDTDSPLPSLQRIDVAAALEELAGLRRAELELMEREATRKLQALDRIRDGIARLGEIGSPDGFLERAAQELGASSDFDRVVISEIADERLVPRAAWSRDEPTPGATLERLRSLSIPLAYPLVEAEVVKRQEPVIVHVDPRGRRSPAALRDALGWTQYVAVALTLSGITAGMLHADAARELDEVDLEAAAIFGEGMTGAYERAALYRSLQHHRRELHSAVAWMSERLAHAGGQADPLGEAATADALGSGDLTEREREVMALLARGMTNLAIARALVISEGTVKYHVKNILRKLQATSRADAVARYLRGAT
jgi:LuxR family transcriptional regulator, regulator of acetate metabolism